MLRNGFLLANGFGCQASHGPRSLAIRFLVDFAFGFKPVFDVAHGGSPTPHVALVRGTAYRLLAALVGVPSG